ncbi:MAG: hypothetical protein KAH48_04865 [Chlorobi bacterium]|nr:hypothetical protein [Chlorobiota bacterium]
MVKIGFIVEGDTEKIILDSKYFKKFCKSIEIEIAEPVIDAEGSGNLLPKNIDNYIQKIRQSQPQKIVVLTDLEEEASVLKVRKRINSQDIDIVFVAVKAIESWFLADTVALASWLKVDSVYEEKPEETQNLPWDRLKELAKENKARGTGPSKPTFAKRFINNHNFSIERAAKHSNCPSAKEFYDTLLAWGK